VTRGPIHWTQADLKRAIKAVLEAGVPVSQIAGIKATRECAVLLFGEQELPQLEVDKNEWDEVLSKK
jgi:hypothetical protein